MKAVRELKRKLPELYNSGKIEQKDVIFLFGKVREILENKPTYKSAFPELYLFCNWCFHTKLTNQTTIYEILLKISRAITNAIDVSPNEDAVEKTKVFRDICSNILNIPNLRRGLKTVLETEGIPSMITTNKEWWDAFTTILLEELSEKPLEFPESVLNGTVRKGNAYKYYTEIMSLINPSYHNKVIRLEIKPDENSKEFTFRFLTSTNVTFVVAVGGKEPISAF